MKKRRNYHFFLVGLSALLLGVVLAVLAVVFYNDSVQETKELLISSVRTNQSAAYHQINDELSLLSGTCDFFQNNPHVRDLLREYADPEISKVRLYTVNNNLTQILSTRIYVSDYISAIYVVTPGRVCSAFKLVRSYEEQPDLSLQPIAGQTLCRTEDGGMFLSFAIPGIENCLVHVELSKNIISTFLEGNDHLVLLDDQGNFHFSKGTEHMALEENLLQRMIEESREADVLEGYCFAQSSFAQEIFNWRLLYVIDSSSYLSAYRIIMLSSILAFVVAMAISLWLSHVIARRVLRPLYGLIERIRNFREGARWNGKQEHGPGLREGVFVNTIISLTVGIVVFVVFFSMESIQAQQKHRQSLNQATLKSISGSLEGNLDKMRNSLVIASVDPRVTDYVRMLPLGKSEKEELEQALQEILNVHPASCSIFIYDVNDTLLYKSNDMITGFSRKDKELARWFQTRDNYGNPALGIFFGMMDRKARLYGLYDSSVVENQMLRLSGGNENIFLLNENGETLDGQAVKFPDGYQAISRQVENTPWSVWIAYQDLSLWQQLIHMLDEHAVLILAMMLSAIFISSLLSSIQLSPLSRLSAAMQKINQGSLPDTASLSGYPAFDELNELQNSFVEMEDRIEMLIDDLVISRNRMLALENAKKNAEINALQMQITPHFLSNSIMLIASRIKEQKLDEAVSMLFTMNKLFRYGIGRRELVISVREEWEYAQAYALIMEARKNLLKFEWDIPQEALDRPTIRLILQPIVENAIYHGKRQDGEATIVRISCRITPKTTVFTVADNGPGVTQERLAEIRERLDDIPGSGQGSSIGLYNVQSRIRLYCGEEYGLDIAPGEKEGVVVTLTVPSQMRSSLLSN